MIHIISYNIGYMTRNLKLYFSYFCFIDSEYENNNYLLCHKCMLNYRGMFFSCSTQLTSRRIKIDLILIRKSFFSCCTDFNIL